MRTKRALVCFFLLAAGAWLAFQIQAAAPAISIKTGAGPAVIRTPAAEFHITPAGYVQAFLPAGGKLQALDEPADAAFPGDYLVSRGKQISSFTLDLAHAKTGAAVGNIGKTGKRIEAVAKGSGDAAGLEKTLAVEVFDAFPGMAISRVSYKNTGNAPVTLDRVVTQRHRVSPALQMSFMGAAETWGQDEIVRFTAKISRQNVVGGPGPKGNGGGLPIVDFWGPNGGVAVGISEALPLVASLPVQAAPDQPTDASIVLAPAITLQPGESYTTPSTFVAAHTGDYYEALSTWAKVIQHQSSWSIARPVAGSYEANWCGWGYESDFTPKQMLDIVPKLKELGFKWATIDLRWHDNYGDWMPRPDTFPGNTLRDVVDTYHKNGLMVQAWYQPLSAEDGVGKHSLPKPMAVSRIIKEHPEWAILDKDGKNARMISPVSTAAALCPAVPEVQQYHKMLIERFFKEFGFDGLKMDAVLTVPLCYNPAHHHKSPEDSIRAMGQLYKLIYDTGRQIKPYSIFQICPCGMVPALAWTFFQDQAVTADPVGSVQVRRRVKMYKALLGPEAAVYGDHVELSGMRRAPGGGGWIEEGTDFASSVGTGAVIGTKFTWPGDPPRQRAGRPSIRLTPERQVEWKKWIDIYNAKRLSTGTFRNLYPLGYSAPEAYAIEKGGKMYYAFYATAQPQWKGQVELRGLQPGKYKVFDYANNKDLGTIDANNPRLNVEFKDNLLVEVSRI
jgi:alpha-galactosidase